MKNPSSPNSSSPSRVVVAISGSGRSLENFLTKQAEFKSFKICGVISSSSRCRGVEITRAHGLPLLIERFATPLDKKTEEGIYLFLKSLGAEWVALAGFLKPFPVRKEWERRILNIHPALLPKYGGKGMYGMHVHEAVTKDREQQSGATVHFVNDHYDEGDIIAQAFVRVEPQDRPETLAARVFRAECDLYPRVLDGLIDGSLPLPNREIMRYSFGE